MLTRKRTVLWSIAILGGTYIAMLVVMGCLALCFQWETADAYFYFSSLTPVIVAVESWRVVMPICAVGLGLIAAGVIWPRRGEIALVGAGLLALTWAILGFTA